MRARSISLVATVLLCGLAAEPDPVSVFADLDGTWAGTFVGFDASGRELYRIAVEQTYRTISPGQIYEINGMGRYGETFMLMNGRYRRIKDP